MKLKDKVAIITGAAGGIGAATARLFAREGALLCISDMDEIGLTRVGDEIKGLGAEVIHVRVDVVDPRSVHAMVDATIGKFGRIDILINNAGLTRDAVSWKMADDHWDLVIDVNLKGTFNCCRAVLPVMRSQSYGKIVNTSSISSLGNVGQANYAAAKAGVSALTSTLALEVATSGINVNAVAPGPIDTAMTQAMRPDMLQEMVRKVPMRRMGRPEEIARLHLFLASDDSSYITGQTIFIDGGITVGI